MNRQNKTPFIHRAMALTPFPVNTQMPPQRVPQAFIEAMKRISSSDTTPGILPKQDKEQRSDTKWKSSFQPINQQDGDNQEEGPSSAERVELYDPSNPLSSDSEPEKSPDQERACSPTNDENSVEHQRLSPDRLHLHSSYWHSAFHESVDPPLDRQKLFTAPTESTTEKHPHNLETEMHDRPGYGFQSRSLEQRGSSPNRLVHGSSTPGFPEAHSRRRANEEEERITWPEYTREMTPTVRSSPPRLKRDHQQLGCLEKGLDPEAPPPKATKHEGVDVIMDQCPITCDLCEVELANAQELEDHLDCKSHWDTLEHIQQNNDYDDLAIAFLQEVMLYKSHHCSRAVEENALQALQQNHHMTKVEMFRCAACKVYVSTSAAEVKAHISSQDHLSNTQDFAAQQRRACLSKAETMLQELQPQLQHFLKGGTPFK
uniref:DBIRD complex subunit ZNF326 n=1 Tax=Nothobranchius kadleci TaxID=1051664 RepID=A0A1A8BU35_NOTKA